MGQCGKIKQMDFIIYYEFVRLRKWQPKKKHKDLIIKIKNIDLINISWKLKELDLICLKQHYVPKT